MRSYFKKHLAASGAFLAEVAMVTAVFSVGVALTHGTHTHTQGHSWCPQESPVLLQPAQQLKRLRTRADYWVLLQPKPALPPGVCTPKPLSKSSQLQQSTLDSM